MIRTGVSDDPLSVVQHGAPWFDWQSVRGDFDQFLLPFTSAPDLVDAMNFALTYIDDEERENFKSHFQRNIEAFIGESGPVRLIFANHEASEFWYRLWFEDGFPDNVTSNHFWVVAIIMVLRQNPYRDVKLGTLDEASYWAFVNKGLLPEDIFYRPSTDH